MKNKNTILMIILLFIGLTYSANAQVNVTLNIENQSVSGSDFSFDLYLTAPNDPLYLGNADFVLTYNNGNFTSPKISKGGTSFCTFVPTTATGNNPLFTQDAYNSSTAVSLSGNEIIINVNGPTPGDQNTFDTRVARIDNSASTHRLGRFTVSGISNAAGTMNLQWDNVKTLIFTMATTTPWNGSAVNSINAVNPSDQPLPVELSTFSVNAVDGANAELNWETATEVNNHGFTIERALQPEGFEKSTESPAWQEVAFVEGHGNSNSPKLYSYTDANLVGGSKFMYRLKQIDIDGTFEYSDVVEVEVIPNKYELMQNYPNPFNPATLIRFSLPEDTRLAINVYNLLGEKVATILNEELKAGFHQVNFNTNSAGYNLASGMYIYTLESKNFSQVKKMILMK